MIEAAEGLRVIARYGVGVDNVDLAAAREKGIVVTNTPGANSDSVAELAVGLMLALARNIPRADQATKAGEWARFHGFSLGGKVVGLVGLGAIGRLVAAKLAGFGCTLLAYDPFATPQAAVQAGVRLTGLDEVIASADFVSLHCPLTEETRGMVSCGIHRQDETGRLPGQHRPRRIGGRGRTAGRAAERPAARGRVGRVRAPAARAADNPLLALPQVISNPAHGRSRRQRDQRHGLGGVIITAWRFCAAIRRPIGSSSGQSRSKIDGR